jgi:hypothetical protein
MSDLAKLRIWDDPAIHAALAWCLDVAENRRPAKFRIAATVATGLDPTAESEEALWAELDRLTPLFLARWQAIRAGARVPRVADGPSLQELCRELAYRMLSHCNFCPWNCRVDRVAGVKFGACKLASSSRVSSHFHHTGEELFYRGTEGSGTIFFTSCNMRCAGEEVWLVGERRSTGEQKYYVSNLPADATIKVLAATIKARWVCEQAHQQLKEELGLDHFEGRSWTGLHRHALMTMIAYAFLQSRRLKTAAGEKKNPPRSAAADPSSRASRRPRRSRKPTARALSALPNTAPTTPRLKLPK